MAERLHITSKYAQPLISGRVTFVSLPGETRNQIYDLCLAREYQRVPLDPHYHNKPDPFNALAQTCSQIYTEVRSYLVKNQTAYIPIMAGMHYNYGSAELHEEYGLTPATHDTIAAALLDFSRVHFHLHLDSAAGHIYDPYALLSLLRDAIRKFLSTSRDVYVEHRLTPRRVTVHVDHLLVLWKEFQEERPMSIGRLTDVAYLLAKDRYTDWEFLSCLPTGQARSERLQPNPTPCLDCNDIPWFVSPSQASSKMPN
ncbi:hypothetical protein GMOD_00004478 [Pyrenophora seminiperda CCB06]|uniref:Uncharacterized protein n=1 Tax=Pyrenophora seminiperda CCB06 TaxID=1302712 RepID=A0A3M7M1E0_9PLEO|nr:hypothetical protein GMOD_00004478 [Pyrenophora seminiperda CCB06]